MKRLTFTGVIDVYGDGELDTTPERFVELALVYGDKHQDYTSSRVGKVKVEDVEEV